jgi:hypothetical protein
MPTTTASTARNERLARSKPDGGGNVSGDGWPTGSALKREIDARNWSAKSYGGVQGYLGHKDIRHTVRYTELSTTRFKNFWPD